MAKKRKYYEGQIIDGKKVIEVFRDSSSYYLHFDDGTYVSKKIKED